MRITVIGTGYVGLVTGACFAESGNLVTCVDINAARIESLNRGVIPIYEPGLDVLVAAGTAAGRLSFSTSYKTVPTADVVLLAVGTPQAEDGAANLSALWSAVDELARHVTREMLVVTKSTVPVGTNRQILERFRSHLGERAPRVASNPEFLREGSALKDFREPDRVVVGVEDVESAQRLQTLYEPFLASGAPFLVMGLESAEMTKYVANCFLATKISFINEMANLCDAVGADINDVRQGIGLDQRIGFSFLFPGAGYGGSCFPKDVRALSHVARSHDCETAMLGCVDRVNEAQKQVLFGKLRQHFQGQLTGRTIAVWGLAFKPGTDDIREAPSLVLIEQLLAAGAAVRAHDPVAIANVRTLFGDRVHFSDDPLAVVTGADALVIVTEWNDYRSPNFERLAALMVGRVIFDGRNIYEPEQVRSLGFTYYGIGRR